MSTVQAVNVLLSNHDEISSLKGGAYAPPFFMLVTPEKTTII